MRREGREGMRLSHSFQFTSIGSIGSRNLVSTYLPYPLPARLDRRKQLVIDEGGGRVSNLKLGEELKQPKVGRGRGRRTKILK